MAVYGEGYHCGFMLAGVDMSATGGLAGPSGSGQFLAVKVSTAADLTVLQQLSSVIPAAVFGICQNRPKLGEAADIQCAGQTKAMYGGTVTRGDLLMVDGSARLITASGSGVVVGQALESGAVSEIHSVNLWPASVGLAAA